MPREIASNDLEPWERGGLIAELIANANTEAERAEARRILAYE
jgi:hypothetical protein